MLNFILFLCAADVLYRLSRLVLKDEYLAYKSALLFCVNPASVFFSAPYSESLFALATFSALLALEAGGEMGLASGVFLGLATAARSNGLVNAGFVLYKSMKIVATQTILFVRAKKKHATRKVTERPTPGPQPAAMVWQIARTAILPGMLNLILCLGPFAAYQWYVFATFCKLRAAEVVLPSVIVNAAERNGYVLPGAENKPEWCFKVRKDYVTLCCVEGFSTVGVFEGICPF